MSTLSPELFVNIHEETLVEAPVDVVFESILEQIGPGFSTMDGKSAPMKLEAWPGGRWYRDLGNNTGHFWGHVQVIKPPTLLELTGPMFMSFAVSSHVQYRLTEQGRSTLMAVTHRAMGEFPAELLANMNKGWAYIIGQIKKRATR
jgi:uncharacterized protein YndB with AHSA1/START domain